MSNPDQETPTRRTALVVVDVQQCFIDAVGPDGHRVLREVNCCIEKAVREGVPIIYTRDRDPFPVPEGDRGGATRLHPELTVAGPVVEKGPGRHGYMSGFLLATAEGPGHGSIGGLAGELRRARVDAVIVVGIAADVCVAATARDALRLGYAATMPLAATSFVHAHPRGDAAAVAELRAAGITVLGDLDDERIRHLC